MCTNAIILPRQCSWYELKEIVLCFRQSALLVYLMSLTGMLAFTFTLTLGHIWVTYVIGMFLG
jgi:hypothetical protein